MPTLLLFFSLHDMLHRYLMSNFLKLTFHLSTNLSLTVPGSKYLPDNSEYKNFSFVREICSHNICIKLTALIVFITEAEQGQYILTSLLHNGIKT